MVETTFKFNLCRWQCSWHSTDFYYKVQYTRASNGEFLIPQHDYVQTNAYIQGSVAINFTGMQKQRKSGWRHTSHPDKIDFVYRLLLLQRYHIVAFAFCPATVRTTATTRDVETSISHMNRLVAVQCPSDLHRIASPLNDENQTLSQ